MEVTSSLKHRDNSIDVIAGILLIHMVLGHVFQFAKLTDCRFYHWMDVLFFFMPWFFFKSGMFFNENKKVADVMIGGGKKLMSNYLIWSLVGQSLYLIERLLVNKFELISFIKISLKSLIFQSALPGNLALWFLLSLYLVTILYSLIRKFIKCEVSIILVLISTSILFEYDIHNPVLLVTVSAGMLFYALGEYLNKVQYKNESFSICLLLYLIVQYKYPSIIDFRTMNLKEGNFYLWILSALAGIVTINNVFKMIPEIRILSFIGQNSMKFYVIHWCLLLVAKIINNLIGSEDRWHYFFLLCLMEVIGFGIISIHIYKQSRSLISTSR